MSGGFDLKAAKTVTLPNGLKIMLLENHRLPMVYVEAKVGRVRMYEPANQNGLAQLTGEMMEEGTKTRDAVDQVRPCLSRLTSMGSLAFA